MFNQILIFLILTTGKTSWCQTGPDPWDDDGINVETFSNKIEGDIPHDLLPIPNKQTAHQRASDIGEWSFKRILALLLKGGRTEISDDGSVQIKLQMRFNKDTWTVLDNILVTNEVLTEEMYRKSLGYIDEAIYKPSVKDKILTTWSEYIQIHLIYYKEHIVWTLGVSGIIGLLLVIGKRLSCKTIIVGVIIMLYLYEVFVSYKEAEQKEMERFLSAINMCKWKFWSSNCEVPLPDLIVFFKHMNPMKIGLRMFTTLISEPLITFSLTTKVMVTGITSDLWFPFDQICYILLMTIFNLTLLIIVLMAIFSFLNIEMNFGAMFGLFNLNTRKNTRGLTEGNNNTQNINNEGKISEGTVHKILDVFSQVLKESNSRAVNIQANASHMIPQLPGPSNCSIKRSSSAGRLSDYSNTLQNQGKATLEFDIRKRNIKEQINKGGGDTLKSRLLNY